jgi:hypothetical protein
MTTKKYEIRVQGCDDRTIIHEDLTDEEAKIIERIADKITKKSESQCQPRMYMSEQGGAVWHCYSCDRMLDPDNEEDHNDDGLCSYCIKEKEEEKDGN